MSGIVNLSSPEVRALWYAAIVAPNCLKRAEDELESLGYRFFAPRLKKWVSHARQKRAVWRPILGRYLFVDIDPVVPLKGPLGGCQSFHSVRACNGVEGLVGIAGEPQALPIGTVEVLMRRQMSGEWNYVDEGDFPDGKGGWRQNERMPIGARVRIVEGELEGMLAVLAGVRKGRYSLRLLGKPGGKTVYPMMVRPAA